MKRRWFIFLILACLGACISSDKKTQTAFQISAEKIDRFYDVDINGCRQRILVRSNVDKNPKAFSAVKSISKIDVPLYFFEGVNDHVIACAPELVAEYCRNVKAPKKKIIWFQNSAHYLNVEEPEKFQDELINILQEGK